MSTAQADWHVSIDGNQQGPYTVSQMRQMVAEGRMPGTAAVWAPGMDEWQHWRKVPELANSTPSFLSSPLPAAGQSTATLADYLSFRRMVTPLLIQIMFWIAVAGVVITSLISIGAAMSAAETAIQYLLGIVMGLLYMVIGPLMCRIACEWIILQFRINETLTDIKNATLKR